MCVGMCEGKRVFAATEAPNMTDPDKFCRRNEGFSMLHWNKYIFPLVIVFITALF